MANEADEFPPESADEVVGLLHLGYLEKEVHWCGHSFVLRTLKAGEELAIALITKEFIESFAASKALATATVAASCQMVDGHPVMAALGPDINITIGDKYRYIKENWYWPVIEALYNEYIGLFEKQIQAFGILEGKS